MPVTVKVARMTKYADVRHMLFSFQAACFYFLTQMCSKLLYTVRPMNAPSAASTAIPIALAPDPLPLMGFPGILVITQSAIRIIVPPIPTKYHGLRYLLIIGTAQNI